MTVINSNFSAGSDAIPEDEDFINKARNLRPFYFIVVCWGENYTNFLFNFCIPSLLAPQNLPALHNRGKNKFLIATTEEDWQRMQSLTAFQTLKEYAEPVFVPIPPCPEGESSCVHMGIGHKSATQIAFEARAYSVLLTPDLMLSDGTMASVQRHAVSGIQVVLVAALRFGEEPLFKNLETLGIAGSGSRLGDEGKPLIATGRQFVAAGIKSFHSETLRYEWDSTYFPTFPVACWWNIPKEDGVLVHCLSWAPLLVDYKAIDNHDSSMLDNWTIDGDYVYRNFGLEGNVHVVQDSDEAMLVSWAPLSDREQSLEPKKYYKLRFYYNLLKGITLNTTYTSNIFDPLKKEIFYLPVFWHSKDLNGKWFDVEQNAISVFQRYLPGPNTSNYEHLLASKSFSLTLLWPLHKSILPINKITFKIFIIIKFILIELARLIIKFYLGFSYYWEGRRRISKVLIKALTGDVSSFKRIKRHVFFVFSQNNPFK